MYEFYIAYYEKNSTSSIATNIYESTADQALAIGTIYLNNIYGLSLKEGQVKVASVPSLTSDTPSTT